MLHLKIIDSIVIHPCTFADGEWTLTIGMVEEEFNKEIDGPIHQHNKEQSRGKCWEWLLGKPKAGWMREKRRGNAVTIIVGQVSLSLSIDELV